MYDPTESEFGDIVCKLIDFGVSHSYTTICPITKADNTATKLAEYVTKYDPSKIALYRQQSANLALFACYLLKIPNMSIRDMATASYFFRALMYDAELTKEECQIIFDFADTKVFITPTIVADIVVRMLKHVSDVSNT